MCLQMKLRSSGQGDNKTRRVEMGRNNLQGDR